MALKPGARLGPYEVISSLGAGGMGEVYRGRDPRVGREVAIKVSAERFSDRFEHEVRAVAALNHPNVCTLYDVGPDYLVMELVEGPTLAQRLASGALPVKEALGVARQIADGVAAAHDKGIVHRDLKPANIKIRPDGTVKVLDFGLAKVMDGPVGAGGSEDSQTLTLDQATRTGTVIGTAAYMAPEQARGEPVDKRADIWAFGVVLYEMLTGHRLFKGATASDTLALVLTREPEWERVPAQARRLLRQCLEKDPRRRLRDIGDAAALLDETAEASSSPARSRWWLAAAAVLLVAVVSAWVSRRLLPAPATSAPVVRLDLDLGPAGTLGANGSNAALSPDGTRLAFATMGPDGKSHLFTRRMDQAQATELAGTEGASAPFFSPDGQSIGFFTPGKLMKIGAEGGTVTALCDAPTSRGASWGEDGNIILTPDVQTRLLRVPAAGGGVPTAITEFSGGEISHRWPQILPGGKAVLFTALAAANFAAFDEADIEVMTLADGRKKTVHQGGSYGRYLESGHLLYVRNGTAFAVPFDLQRLEAHGTPAPVLEQVAYISSGGSAQLDISKTGTLVYGSRGAAETQNTIEWLYESSRTETLLGKPGFYRWLRLSPDGTRLVYRQSQGSANDLWVYDWQRGIETRLTTDPGIHNSPIWTPDGPYIIYQAEGGMYRLPADGGGKPQLVMAASNTPYPESVTADSKRLAYSVSNPVSGDLDIWTAPLEISGDEMKAGKPEPLVQTPAHERDAAFSPDGRWLAYTSTESGTYEVYVRSMPGAAPKAGGKWRISSGGGYNPVWSRTSRELFYRATDNRLMEVSYSIREDAFAAEKARLWADRAVLAATDIMPSFDLTPDGKRFAVFMQAQPQGPSDTRQHVTLELNFFDEVRRRLAAGTK